MASQSLSQSAVTHTGVALQSGAQMLAISAAKFGTLTNDCTLELHVSIDGGSNYRIYKTYTNAQMQAANGIYDCMFVHGTHYRFYLNVGTMTGANGMNVRGYN